MRGGSYVFTDTQVIAGQTYWYELEEIELSGKATRLERTKAVARPQGVDLLNGLPCASINAVLLFSLFGVGLVTGKLPVRRRRP